MREGWSAGMWKGRKKKDGGVREKRRNEKRGRRARKLGGGKDRREGERQGGRKLRVDRGREAGCERGSVWEGGKGEGDTADVGPHTRSWRYQGEPDT